MSSIKSKRIQNYRNPRRPVAVRIDDLLGRLTLDEKISLLSETAPAIPRLGLRAYHHGNEALHGVVRPGRFTVFPRPTGLAATFNPALVRRMADCISDEGRAAHNRNRGRMIGGPFGGKYNGLLVFWSPVVNMVRDPRWGRTGETYGEDPHLTSRMGVAFVKGLQGTDRRYLKAVATPKHFVANNEEHNRFSCKAKIPERSLREYYLPGYRACIVEGKAESIMAAYNAVNGEPCSASRRIMTDILRDEWGFEGYVVGDLNSVFLVKRGHHYTGTMAQTAAVCIQAGVDLDSGFQAYPSLKTALKQKLIVEADIDRAVRCILHGRLKLGLLDPKGSVPFDRIKPEVIGCAKHQRLALRAARESMVLLKNARVGKEPLLPLETKAIRSLAVIGPNCRTYKHHHYSGDPLHTPITPIDGIQAAAARKNITVNYVPWMGAADDFVAVPAMFLSPDRNDDRQGLRGRYFNNRKLTGKPAAVRVDAMIDFDRAGQQPDPLFANSPLSIRWQGVLTVPAAGVYKLSTLASDGVRLSLDGKCVIDRWKRGGTQRDTVSVTLEAGQRVAVVLEYFDAGGDAIARLQWQPPKLIGSKSDPYVAAAKQSDVVIAILGLNEQYTGEGKDKNTLDLPADQQRFIRRVVAANPRTVVVLINSVPLAINWIDANVPAILEAWFPGEQGGRAIAEVLLGKHTPAGRLPMTFYKSVSQLPPFNDYDITNGRTYLYLRDKPLYAFGHGLSYTTFAYSMLRLSKSTVSGGDCITVCVDVKNTGTRDGEEVVQLYVRRPGRGGPIRELKGFKRVKIKTGATKTVSIPLKIADLACWNDRANAFAVKLGTYELQIGAASDDIRLMRTLNVR